MPQKLTKFKVRKVSLVPWGANDAEISFKKSAPGSDEVLIFKSETGDNSMSKEFKFKKEG